MFHAGGHKGASRGRASGFSRHYPGLLSDQDWKQPLRCGVLFCTFSCVLFVIGVILTWLGTRRSVHDVFGESVPITGPILLAVGGLMLLLAFRQFYIARQRQLTAKKMKANKDAVKLANAKLEDGDDQEMTRLHDGKYDDDEYAKAHLYDAHHNGTMDDSAGGVAGNGMACGSYYWPSGIVQPPYYSMALMATCKDPAYASYSAAALALYTRSAIGNDLALGAGYSLAMQNGDGASGSNVTQPVATSASLPGSGPETVTTCGDTTPLVSGGHASSAALPLQDATNGSLQEPGVVAEAGGGGSAVIEPSSITVRSSPSGPSQTQAGVASASASASASSPAEVGEAIPESQKIFPADYLFSRTSSGRIRRTDGSGGLAAAGISNLPNATAAMMLRTLEITETI